MADEAAQTATTTRAETTATPPPAPDTKPPPAPTAEKPAEGPQPSAPRERDEHGKFKPAEKPADPATEGATPPPGTPPQAAADPYAALALPDGFGADDELLAEAKGIFAELKIPADKAQDLVNIQVRVEQKRLADAVRHQKALTEQTKNDPEYGGVLKWPATETKLAAIRQHVGAKFIDALNAQGLGNHPEVIRGLLKLHDAAGLSEDRLVPGGRAPVSDARARYPNTPGMNP